MWNLNIISIMLFVLMLIKTSFLDKDMYLFFLNIKLCKNIIKIG